MPVFRRGIAATHPGKHYNGRPEFMIDAACYPGSSGSLVFLHQVAFYDRKTKHIAWDTSGSRTQLLGILHSGPQYPVAGEIKIVAIPTINVPISVTPLMLHLGIVVRAEKLFDFEPILHPMMKPPTSTPPTVEGA
jgi:hypothetical protein